MDGFWLYKYYTSRGELARRETPEWAYGQLLTEAFYVVGVTKLFDMLEQAERLGQQIELVYSAYTKTGTLTPTDIQLIEPIQPTAVVDDQFNVSSGGAGLLPHS